ncbi:MAG: glycoside hydrolase family 32 protein [Treponemataceae bacterium]
MSNHEKNILHAQQKRSQLAQSAHPAVHRQTYHYTAPAGWLNDPNGLIYFRGKYHLFYQHNPFAPVWASMHWGHAHSSDLLHWQELPLALAPSEPYDSHERGGCFSGSAVEKDGTLYLFYTGCIIQDGKSIQTQCLATSTDGIHFQKHPLNPLIALPPHGYSQEFRDPKVFFHGNHWYMVVGASIGGQETGDGRILLYQSSDLLHWSFFSEIASSNGQWGAMWECPDLFELDGKWVLLFSPIGMATRRCVYFVGSMDFTTGTFTMHNSSQIDFGSDFYAPQTFEDHTGKRIMIAWLDSWDVPSEDHPTKGENWRGGFTIPRILSIDENNTLLCKPVSTLDDFLPQRELQHDMSVHSQDLAIEPSNPLCYKLTLTIDVQNTNATATEVHIRSSQSEKICLVVDYMRQTLTFDNKALKLEKSAHDISKNDTQEVRIPLCITEPTLELCFVCDTSSCEVFVNNGRICISSNIFNATQKQSAFCRSIGGITQIQKLEIATPQ